MIRKSDDRVMTERVRLMADDATLVAQRCAVGNCHGVGALALSWRFARAR